MRKILIFLLFFGFGKLSPTKAQSIDTVQFTYVSEFLYESFLPYSCYSARFDDQPRPFLYTANVELGIVVFDVTDIQNPIPIDTVLPAEFGGLKPTNLWHQNGLLYASVGGIQGASQDAGLAIMEVSDPHDLTVLDYWTDPAYDQGAAIVIVDGDYAYLGAMEQGIIVLNVSDPNAISFEGHAPLDPNFPQVPGLFSTPNARGMSIRNDTLIVANDAGGLRMVSVVDKQDPYEISKYINQDMHAITQAAYNNVLLVDEFAYIPVDYCGLDIVDVSDTSMVNANWLNPWGCDGSNWNGAEGHSNEIERVEDNLIFMSGGDSELLAYDVSERSNPILVGEYVFPYDSVVAWGITANDQYVILALVNNRVFQQPYYSDVGGIMILEWNVLLGIDENEKSSFNLYPNPSSGQVTLEVPGEYMVRFTDITGQTMIISPIKDILTISTTGWANGIYIVSVLSENGMSIRKLVVL